MSLNRRSAMHLRYSLLVPASMLILTFITYKLNANDQNPPPQIETIEKKLVDMHTHIACQSESEGCYFHKDFKGHWKFKSYLLAMGVTQKEIDEKGDGIVAQKLSELVDNSKFVSHAIVLALDGYYDNAGNLDLNKTQLIVPNSFIYKQTLKYKNLIYGASIHPYRKDAIKELTLAHQRGAVLIKWIPCVMGIAPDSDDPRITQFYQKMVEFKMTLLSHTGNENSFIFSDNKLCDPKKLSRPLDLGVNVVASHLATKGSNDGEENIERIKKLLKDYPKLKFDISSLTNGNKWNHIKYALEFKGRFYYGTDYPLIRARLFGIPLSSAFYYKLKINKQWENLINSLTNPLDQDVALKMALGIKMLDLEKSREFIQKLRI